MNSFEKERIESIIVDLGTWLTEEWENKVKEYQIPFLKKELEKGKTILILSGGHTNPLFPTISEALLKFKLLISEGLPADKIFLEEASIRTTQNIKFSFNLISLLGIEPQKIIFTGERGSEREVKFLSPRYSLRILGYVPEIEFFGISYLKEKKRKSKEMRFILIIIGYYFPPFDWFLTISRWFKIRLKCFRYRKILCLGLFHWGCQGCKIKEITVRRIRVK